MFATVERIEYDPNRTAFIALITYEDGLQSYILAPSVCQQLVDNHLSHRIDIKPGNAIPLADIPIGTIIHNMELKPGKGGSVGAFCWNIYLNCWP